MKYTKKQILEAIQYWQKQLDFQESTQNSVADTRNLDVKKRDYRNFYCKLPSASTKSYNVIYDDLISESIEHSAQTEDVLQNSYCVFNPNSLTNVIRRKQNRFVYLNEVDKQTKNTDELTYEIMKIYQPEFNRLKLRNITLDDIFKIYAYDIDETGEIAGNVTYSMLMPNKDTAEKYVRLFSRIAYLCGYNYMDHRLSNCVISDKDIYEFQIDFEASYFSSNVKVGDILYHVTAESNVDKILKYGLVAGNKNSHGFNYESRVFCFVDKYKHIAKRYAAIAGKESKKFIKNKDIESELMHSYILLKRHTDGVLVNTNRYALLAIDTAKLKDVKFYRDNTFDDGNGIFFAVFSTQNIIPAAISVVARFNT